MWSALALLPGTSTIFVICLWLLGGGETDGEEHTLAWASFQTREEAEQAHRRLEENGFARNSIDLDRRQDGTFTVEVHTREENLPRVEHLLHTSASMYAVRQLGSNIFKTVTTHLLVMIGGAALAGLVVYSLLPRNRRPWSISSLESRAKCAIFPVPSLIVSPA